MSKITGMAAAGVSRISSSSYSNTAPLVWSFLYGPHRGSVELIMDTAPARSAQLLAEDRVDAALVPVIASQSIDDVKVIPDICVGTERSVKSVCLITNGCELSDAKSVALDISSRTSVALTKVIFREFYGREPQWIDAEPDIDAMLAAADAALLIGDPALKIAAGEKQDTGVRCFDLAEVWHTFTGLGFIFAMWMTQRDRCDVALAEARDEGTAHIAEIASNYTSGTGLSHSAMVDYLSNNITYRPSRSMLDGLDLYLKLAHEHGLIPNAPILKFL